VREKEVILATANCSLPADFVIVAIPDHNPSGGLPSESIQFGSPCRIMVAEPLHFMLYACS